MRRPVPAIFFLCLGVQSLLLCFLGVPAEAQAPAAGSLQGTVTDPTGAVMPGVEVEIQNQATGARRRVQTDSTGRYVAPALVPGLYRVTLSAPGFALNIFEGVEITVGQDATLDVKLDPMPLDIFEIVPGWVDRLEPGRTEVSVSLRETAVLNLPLNGRRWEDLVLLTPAVTEDGGNGLISYRGLSGLYNSNLVDGVDNNQAFFSETRGRSRLPYVYSLSTVQEFQVITQNYSAESGRAAGGIVNAVTRSGTNWLHGELFYFFRDDALLARDPLAKALGQPKPEERMQQFGAALGGPLIRNRLFWFGAYDQQLRNFPFTVVPQDPNFAAACTLPECPAAMDFIRSLLGVRPRQGDQNLFLVKLDSVTQGHTLSGVFNYVNWRAPNGILRDPVVNDAAEALGRDDVRAEFFIFNWQVTPTPRITNQFRFHFGRDFEFQEQNTSGPLIDLTGFRAIRLGMREFLPRVAFPNEKRFQWMDNFGWVKGRHFLKFGADINHTRDTVVQVFRGGGIYRWRTANDFALDFAGACPANGGRCYRDFVQAVDPFGGDGGASFATTDWAFYVQDSLRLGPHLLLNLGLRYERQQMPEPPRPNPAVPMTATLNTDTNNLAPRVGLAWQPAGADALVVRAGYGIYYGRTPNSTLFSHLFQNGVSQQAFRFTPNNCAAPIFPNVVFTPPSGAPLGPPAPGLPTPVVQSPPTGCAINPSASVVTTLAPDFVNPLVHQADFGLEYELAPDWTISGTYLMSRTNRLPVFLDSNVAPATGTTSYVIGDAQGNLSQMVTLPFYSQRLNPALGAIQTGYSVVNAWFHGFVVELKKRFSRGFYVDAHLTVSKATDNGVVPAALGTFSGSSVPVDPFDLRREHALSDLDARRRFVFHAYWELPWTKEQSPAGKVFLQGWKLSAIGQFRDATPRTALVSGAPACAVNGGLTCGSIDGFGFPAVTYRTPHLGRNTFYGRRSGRATVDLRVGRNFPLGEGKRLEFAADAFNLFNRTHFTSFNSLAFNFVPPGSTAVTTGLVCPVQPGISGCLFPRPDFLEPERSGTRILGARQLQLSLRFFF